MLTAKQSATAAWVLGGLVFGLLVVRNAGLASPLLSGDEYAYFAQAKAFPAVTALYERDPAVQRVFNPLFAAIGHAFMEQTRYAERALSAFNVLLFALVVVGVLALTRYLSANGASPFVAACVAVLSPLSVYTAYFMPEMLYFTLTLGVLVALVFGFRRAPFLAVAGAGCCVGALALVKSHALSVAGAALLSVCLLGWLLERTSLLRTAALAAVLLATAVATLVLLHLALTHELITSPRTLIGFYSGYVSASVQASTWKSTLPSMVANLGAHGVVALCFAAPPIGLLILIAVRALRRDGGLTQSPTDAARARFACVALCILCGALAMTVVFTAAAERKGEADQLLRLHGRYYSYALLPIIVAYFAMRDVLTPRDTRLLGGVGLLATLAMFAVRAHFNLFPWDYPEAYVLTGWPSAAMGWTAYVVLGAGVLTYGPQIWLPQLARFSYPAFLATAYVFANLAMSQWLSQHSVGSGRYSEAGRAMSAMLGDEELQRTLVVAPEHYGNAPLAHFLFGLSANPYVVIKPVGEHINPNDVPPGIMHLVTLGQYNVGAPQRARLGAADWTLYELGGPGLRVRQSAAADLWDGNGFDVLPGVGHDTSSLDGFNQSEPWGAWTATDPASVALPVLVSGPVRLFLDGWVVPENAGTELDVQIGTSHASVRFGETRSTRCVTLNVERPSRDLVIRGAVPRRPDPWQRALGLAVARVAIARPEDKSLADACAAAQPR